MKRIRTTYVGNLLRSQDVVELILARQVAAGVAIVSDGEMSKISYAT